MKKKSILMASLAVLAMASCSNDETIEISKSRAIDFRTTMQTRGVEVNTGNLTKFKAVCIVNGERYFGDDFSKSGGFFTSEAIHNWLDKTSEHTFYAFAPFDAAEDNKIQNDKQEIVDFSPNANVKQQVDLVTATATGTQEANSSTGVPLTFEHALSQIEVQAKNANPNYTYKVAGVRFGKPVSQGTFDLAAKKWTLSDSEKTNYEFVYDNSPVELNNVAKSLMFDNGNAMLLPQQLTGWDSSTDKTNSKTGAYLSVKIQITAKSGMRIFPKQNADEYGWASIALDTNWEAGKKYVYTLDFTNGAGKKDPDTQPEEEAGEDILGEPIKFTVEVKQWEEAPVQNKDM